MRGQFSGANGDGNIHFPCSDDHEQDWQPYSVGPYSATVYVMAYTGPPAARGSGVGSSRVTCNLIGCNRL